MWFIPGLKRNFISLAQLDKEGHTIKVEGGKVKVFLGSLVIIKGVIRNGLYELQGSYLDEKNSVGMVGDKVQNKRNVKFEVEQSFDFEMEPLVEDSTFGHSESEALVVFAASGVESYEQDSFKEEMGCKVVSKKEDKRF